MRDIIKSTNYILPLELKSAIFILLKNCEFKKQFQKEEKDKILKKLNGLKVVV